jgi:hypothetical protein
MPIAHSLKSWDICGIVLWDQTAHFRHVPSTMCTCVMIVLFNQLLDMPHLSGGWIIFQRRNAHLQGCKHICEQNERNKLFVGCFFTAHETWDQHIWHIIKDKIKLRTVCWVKYDPLMREQHVQPEAWNRAKAFWGLFWIVNGVQSHHAAHVCCDF